MMKAITILTFASLSVTGALGQNITSVLAPSGKKHTHIFGWERGPVSIDARIFSHGDLSDFFMLDYKGVNIFLWDMDQIQEFYSVLKSYAEETPVPSGIRVNGTWSTSMLTGGLVISDAARNQAKLKKKHFEFVLECMEEINSNFTLLQTHQ
jgi:hypothetical protein